MEQPCRYTFANELTAEVIQVHHEGELPVALDKIGLDSKHPALVLVGGASGIGKADMSRLQRLFVEAIAPIAQELGVAVVDGGTDAGIMRFIGQARTEIGGTFPLIGVAAIGTVILPENPPPFPDAAPLESNHTHFVFVPGSNWGDESPWLAHIASLLSEGFPSVTVVVNGGEITFKDVSYSVQADRPVVTLDGTGRTADKLAAALRGEATDGRATQLAASGQLRTIDLNNELSRIDQVIREILSKLLDI
ncbi:MAG: hypothetical protein ICV55_16205 [Coleofasciculus sp. C3-bin4]|nr:hypothetical protein [Coleofasciculus sp. C3-bin4]